MSSPPKLTRVYRLDSIQLDKSFFTPEGFFIDAPIVTRTGIFEYKNPDGSIRRELRLPKHVFAQESLASYEGKPVIITHDAQRVDIDNPTDDEVGKMLSKGYRDGDAVRVRLVIDDIKKVKRSGLRYLSLGYSQDLDETPGTWNGQPYDAVQTNININHLALVRNPRAGQTARLNLDSKNEKGATNMGTKKTMTSDALKKALADCKTKGLTTLDGKELALIKEIVELAKDGTSTAMPGENNDAESVIPPEEKYKHLKEKFDARCDNGYTTSPEDMADLFEYIEYLQARHDASSAAADAKSEDGEAELTNLDSVDAIISERLRLGRLGDKLNLDGLEEKSPLEAKKAIIKAVLPAMRLDGKSGIYIGVAFDQAVEQMNSRKDINYQRRQMSQRLDGANNPAPTGQSAAEKARERMINRSRNGGNEE